MVFFFSGRAKPDLCESEVKNMNVIDALATVSIICYLTLPEICGISNCCCSSLTTFLFYVRMQQLMQFLSFTTSELSQEMIGLTSRWFFLSSFYPLFRGFAAAQLTMFLQFLPWCLCSSSKRTRFSGAPENPKSCSNKNLRHTSGMPHYRTVQGNKVGLCGSFSLDVTR